MSSSYSELKELSDEELIARHDNHARTTSVGVSYYLDELARRESGRINESMLKCTKWITAMTTVMLGATIANVILAIVR
ncbi:hypothetical protein Shel_17630 [Slackia heliotrinireducens DSM 20476]|uniref:Uncharacterized protein n=1 Tax=Slackia heliotrinireducens (strain ATCC 29202 / DSM 20476 / NCTC 11029 / RHS 1) TaxID=471855 RepID=C7N797_SLAHD|nr:hypothetical protein Shel_17630 [Slackia heliotrinireducens DSM 20476]